MYNLFVYLSIASIYDEDIYSVYKENNIDSTCKFNTLRIKKENILCNDFGIYKKYCDHYSLTDEFTILKEIGLENKIEYTIKPSKIYQQIQDNKIVLADLHYTFKCHYLDNEPQLYLTIIPRNDKSIVDEVFEFIIGIIIFIFIKSSQNFFFL